jgi:hypothetical protein
MTEKERELQNEIHRLNDIIRRIAMIGGWDLVREAVKGYVAFRKIRLEVHGK